MKVLRNNKININYMSNLSFHRPMNALSIVENLLIALGWKGIDDYDSCFSSKDLDKTMGNGSCPLVQSYLTKLGIPSSTNVSIIGALRSALNQYNVPFEMIHKRDGNYLVLKAPDTSLINYLEQKKFQSIASESAIQRVLDVPGYLSSLEYITVMETDGETPLSALAMNVKKDGVICYHTKLPHGRSMIHSNGHLYIPMPSHCDLLYDFRVILYKPGPPKVVLGEWVPEVLVNGVTMPTPVSIASSIPMSAFLMQHVWLKVPLNEEYYEPSKQEQWCYPPHPTAMISYKGGYLQYEHRRTVMNSVRVPEVTGLFESYIGNRLLDNVSEFYVHGRHLQIEVTDGAAVIPVTTSYTEGRTHVKLNIINPNSIFTLDPPSNLSIKTPDCNLKISPII